MRSKFAVNGNSGTAEWISYVVRPSRSGDHAANAVLLIWVVPRGLIIVVPGEDYSFCAGSLADSLRGGEFLPSSALFLESAGRKVLYCSR